jgi:hypothetical protein
MPIEWNEEKLGTVCPILMSNTGNGYAGTMNLTMP